MIRIRFELMFSSLRGKRDNHYSNGPLRHRGILTPQPPVRQTGALPLSYEALERIMRIELIPQSWQDYALPLCNIRLGMFNYIKQLLNNQ